MTAILETILYAKDLDAAEAFYGGVLSFEKLSRSGERQVFYRLDGSMLLIFNPEETRRENTGPLPVPPHGTDGSGHACFKATGTEIAKWQGRLEAAGVAIESDFEWPQGGRSIYFRDPAGNSLEFAEPRIWGLA